MEYEKTILELIERVVALEEKVAVLEGNIANRVEKPARGKYTEMIIDYINMKVESAKKQGLNNITLISGNIQKDVGLKNRLPLVCNAMRKCMDDKSEIVYETPSGQSSTFTIKLNF